MNLLNYGAARDFQAELKNSNNLKMIRKIDDKMGAPWFLTELHSPFNKRSKYVYANKTGSWQPFGPFSRFYEAGYDKKGIYEDLKNTISTPVKCKDGSYTNFIEVAKDSYFEHLELWGEDLPEEFRWTPREWRDSFSGWLYGTVDGIVGESLVVKRVENAIKGSGFDVRRAPNSMERMDVDLLISKGNIEYKGSIKTGKKTGIRKAIDFKRSEGKIPDFYAGFVRDGKSKKFYVSGNGQKVRYDFDESLQWMVNRK